MNKKFLIWSGVSLLVVLMLSAAFFAGRQVGKPGTALAQQEMLASPPDIPDAPELASFYCSNVNNVAAFDNRIHLRCSTSNGGVTYYAYPSHPAHFSTANQMLAIGNTAFALNKGVWMYYNSDPNLNPPGCLSTDCRGLWGVSMIE